MDDLHQTIMQLPLNLYHTAIALRSEISRRLTAEFGDVFTADYWFILTTLTQKGAMSQTHLATHLNRDNASISRTIGCMERLDLIRKTQINKNVIVEPSNPAHDFIPKAEAIIKDILSTSLNGLKPIEIMEMSRMLNQIANDKQH